jgi:hypothetical protein
MVRSFLIGILRSGSGSAHSASLFLSFPFFCASLSLSLFRRLSIRAQAQPSNQLLSYSAGISLQYPAVSARLTSVHGTGRRHLGRIYCSHGGPRLSLSSSLPPVRPTQALASRLFIPAPPQPQPRPQLWHMMPTNETRIAYSYTSSLRRSIQISISDDKLLSSGIFFANSQIENLER